ncbi:uncharacterized protein DS421_7g217880 [Arachis hypogaea]|nr:uncharacterized protein DS421_7g217880 [Arachis hypogaea]
MGGRMWSSITGPQKRGVSLSKAFQNTSHYIINTCTYYAQTFTFLLLLPKFLSSFPTTCYSFLF